MAELDRERLAAVLGMMGSDHDGEALTAARTACRLLKAAGLTWPQVIDGNGNSTIFAAVHRLLAENEDLRAEVDRLRRRITVRPPQPWLDALSIGEAIEGLRPTQCR